MWTKTFSITTKDITKEQIWKLASNINNWHTLNNGIEYAELHGKFEKGNHYIIRPKNGQNIKVNLLEVTEYKNFLELVKFPLAKMYYNHLIEETPNGLKLTNTITVEGLLSFLWVKLVVQKIADALPADLQEHIKIASKL
jgi:hypothetical protein